MRLYQVIGAKWTMIAKSFPNRTANNVKNRQKQLLRRVQRATRLGPRDAAIASFDPAMLTHFGAQAQSQDIAAAQGTTAVKTDLP
jgi:hypothetical protein